MFHDHGLCFRIHLSGCQDGDRGMDRCHYAAFQRHLFIHIKETKNSKKENERRAKLNDII